MSSQGRKGGKYPEDDREGSGLQSKLWCACTVRSYHARCVLSSTRRKENWFDPSLLTPEKRATEAFQVWAKDLLRFRLPSCYFLGYFRRSESGPTGVPKPPAKWTRNKSRNRLRNGPEMNPKPVLQEGAQVSPKVMSQQLWSTGARERPSINFNDV